MRWALQLAVGLKEIGGGRKRTVLFAMAFYANSNGKVHAGDRRLRNAVEMGRYLYEEAVEDLEADGWLKRQGDYFVLAIGKMEANQRFELNSAENLSARGCKGPQPTKTVCLGTPTVSRKG
jgi:hypothetical protein